MKQMQSGALLLFAFFMITDPKTTPDRRVMRMGYAVLVAALGAWLQYSALPAARLDLRAVLCCRRSCRCSIASPLPSIAAPALSNGNRPLVN